jgi:hypothetical protein
MAGTPVVCPALESAPPGISEATFTRCLAPRRTDPTPRVSNLGICWAARQTNFELKSRPYLHRIESRRQRSTRPSATTSTPSRLLERDLTGSRQSCSTQLVLQKPVSTIPSVLRSPPTHRPTQMVAGLLRQLGASAARQGRECRGGIRGFSQCCRRGQSEVEVPHTTGLDRWLALSSE